MLWNLGRGGPTSPHAVCSLRTPSPSCVRLGLCWAPGTHPSSWFFLSRTRAWCLFSVLRVAVGVTTAAGCPGPAFPVSCKPPAPAVSSPSRYFPPPVGWSLSVDPRQTCFIVCTFLRLNSCWDVKCVSPAGVHKHIFRQLLSETGGEWRRKNGMWVPVTQCLPSELCYFFSFLLFAAEGQ